MIVKTKEISEFLAPVRIVDFFKVDNCDFLLNNLVKQVPLHGKKYAMMEAGGFIILDYGKEVSGGIRLLTQCVIGQSPTCKVRIRFGESVTEASSEIGEKNSGNHHSTRDFICNIQNLSEIRLGSTGFRFIRIDNIDCARIGLLSVQAEFIHTDAVRIGSFECDDKIVNEIFSAADRTLFLNMQNNVLWDGVKRDRLVWSGDLYVEMLSCFYNYGNVDNIGNSINLCFESANEVAWVNRIPSYSLWLVLNVYNYFEFTGDCGFFKDNLQYFEDLLDKLDVCVSDDGEFVPSRLGEGKTGMPYFIDWPTAANPDAAYAVNALLKAALRKMLLMYEKNGLINDKLNKLYCKVKEYPAKLTDSKALNAVQSAFGDVTDGAFGKSLTEDGASGISTFMSYFILSEMFKAGFKTEALKIFREYFGAMLEMGATTFFEDFDISWKEECFPITSLKQDGKADMHGDKGAYCYKGFRHSLCHGWACGAIPFLIECVIGLKIIEPGFKKISITPEMEGFEKIECSVATPYGPLEIKLSKNNGKINKIIKVPDEITIIN